MASCKRPLGPPAYVVPGDLGDAWEPAPKRRRRVLVDELEDMDLRGELWREETVARGRGVKRKRIRVSRMPPQTKSAGVHSP